MFDLGQETHLEALGKTWRIGRMTIGVVERFVDWVRSEATDPFVGLEKILPHLSREDALAEIKEAKEKRAAIQNMDLTSPVIAERIKTARGSLRMFLFMLQQNHPDATLETVMQILNAAGTERLQEAIARGQGQMPPPGNGQAPTA